MTELKNIEADTAVTTASGADEDVIELGQASRETRGIFGGNYIEISLLPWRLF